MPTQEEPTGATRQLPGSAIRRPEEPGETSRPEEPEEKVVREYPETSAREKDPEVAVRLGQSEGNTRRPEIRE